MLSFPVPLSAAAIVWVSFTPCAGTPSIVQIVDEYWYSEEFRLN